MPKETTVGFVGLGLMGMPMADRLLTAGYQLIVWNRSLEKTRAIHQAGAKVANTPCEVAEASEVIFSCVTNTAAVENVVFSPLGISEADGQDKLLIDHSSIHPAATRNFAERLQKRNGMSWLDAPVSGGVTGVLSDKTGLRRAGRFRSFVG